jgi:pimeloyl-ACP methyl ester carboxylesterase
MTLAIETHGSGPPLVLIHGVGSTRAVWRGALPALARSRAVCALDVPGFGESPPLDEGFELLPVAEAIAAGLVERVDPPFDLLGSSLGGALALTLAVRRPELVRRLLLCAPAGFRSFADPLARLAGLASGTLLAVRRRTGRLLAGSATARRALLAGVIADGAGLAETDARMLLEASAGAARLRPAVAAAARADLHEELAALRQPLGLVWGDTDRVIPTMTAERILAVRPETPLELVPHAGHIPHLERPAQFAAAVERLFERLPPAEAGER